MIKEYLMRSARKYPAIQRTKTNTIDILDFVEEVTGVRPGHSVEIINNIEKVLKIQVRNSVNETCSHHICDSEWLVLEGYDLVVYTDEDFKQWFEPRLDDHCKKQMLEEMNHLLGF